MEIPACTKYVPTLPLSPPAKTVCGIQLQQCLNLGEPLYRIPLFLNEVWSGEILRMEYQDDPITLAVVVA